MDEFTRDDLRELVAHRCERCVSIYLPTHRTGPDIQEDRIRFKNLLRQAERLLASGGARKPEISEVVGRALEMASDALFWQHQAEGLALFLAPDLMRVFRAPVAFPEVAVVADRFHVKPLLPLLEEQDRFYVLSISQNDVRLFRMTRHWSQEIALEGVPRSMDEALKYDSPQKQLQFYTGAPSAGGARGAMFHGHGTSQEDAKDDLRRFFLLVDEGLGAHLKEERAPLVLAAVDYLMPIYRQVSSYPHLAGAGIAGNPEGLGSDELRAQAWPLVEPVFLKARQEAAERFYGLAGTGRASGDLPMVLRAAHEGRIDTLFVAVGEQRWGKIDPETGEAVPHEEAQPGDEDLLNVVATQALVHGGTVYAVAPADVPSAGKAAPLAAVFRY